MQLETLLEMGRAGRLESLDLLSLEGGFYVLQIHVAGRLHRLVDPRGDALRLRSVEHARQLLEALPDTPLFLVQQSAYDEMCGLEEGVRPPLRVPVGLRSGWASIARD